MSIKEGESRIPPRLPTPAQQAVLDACPIADPRALEVAMFVVRAYRDLETCRSFGMIAGRIPINFIWDWVGRHGGLDREAQQVIVDAIRHVDDADFVERTKPKSKTPPPRQPRGSVARQAAQGADR